MRIKENTFYFSHLARNGFSVSYNRVINERKTSETLITERTFDNTSGNQSIITLYDLPAFHNMCKILFLVLAGIAVIGARIPCTKNYCEKLQCKQETCGENQVLVKNGGSCGCCDMCKTIIKEGEACPQRRFVGGPPPAWECEMGTTCMDTGDGWICLRDCEE
ncbi:uncharacterized protein TNIN_280471 [Trichonephila inaurata madagascariensis]|uniref:Uncharacterized protein n=1 Tax=Trichonephila inaurata madagascariensis TaxID=2747483 RepID=A0A8X6X3N9_9ARAC|nr:uncharacterized protein TNIN_280471 [Trichonephila inaurata madagascariensis]